MSETDTDSGLVKYARDEMQRAGLFDEDADYGGMLADSVMRVVEVFAAAGHSAERSRWGWGAHRVHKSRRAAKAGPLCTSCTLWTDDELAALTSRGHPR